MITIKYCKFEKEYLRAAIRSSKDYHTIEVCLYTIH